MTRWRNRVKEKTTEGDPGVDKRRTERIPIYLLCVGLAQSRVRRIHSVPHLFSLIPVKALFQQNIKSRSNNVGKGSDNGILADAMAPMLRIAIIGWLIL